METLVVGAGAMGRWLARALREDGPSVSLAFVDTDRDAAEDAATTLDGRALDPGTDETFDAVCIAVPMPAAADTIREYAPSADRAIYDVTGRMDEPLAAMREHAPDRERVSLHPLFAPANEPGNVPVVADATGPVTDAVRETLTARGNDLFETTAEEHDRAMETVQARTHATVLSFALAAEPVADQFHTPISEGLAALAEQVTDGDPRVYADIQAAFGGADEVAEAARDIADADTEEFKALFEEAGEDR